MNGLIQFPQVHTHAPTLILRLCTITTYIKYPNFPWTELPMYGVKVYMNMSTMLRAYATGMCTEVAVRHAIQRASAAMAC